jgi:hypothetical protein
MAKFRTIKNSLLGGQLSPAVLSRTDHPAYHNGCELLKNMIPKLSGGAYRRPGTVYVPAGLLDIGSYRTPRLFPFIVSKTLAYCIQACQTFDGGWSVYAHRAVSNLPAGYHSVSIIGNLPYSNATVGSLADAVAAGYQYGLGCDDELQEVQTCQSADVLYMTHPKHPPYTIMMTSLDVFTLQAFDYGLTGWDLVNARPFLNMNVTGSTLQPSAKTGAITLILSPASGDSFRFNAGHVGSIFVINQNGSLGAVLITGFGDTTTLTGTVITGCDFASTTAYATWWESAWSDYRGWPKSCCLFQNRLLMAGTWHQPDSIWNSYTDSYKKFSLLGSTVDGVVYCAHVDNAGGDGKTTGPSGSQPFRITLNQATLDKIQWLSPDKELLVGTFSQEYVVAPNGDYAVGTYAAAVQSKYGSDGIEARRIGYELIFSTASHDEIRAYQYNYLDQSYFAEPIQLMFDQYPKPETNTVFKGRRKIRYMDWDISRTTLWLLDTAGNFYGLTRDRRLSLSIWHTHEFGGYDASRGSVTVGESTAECIDPSYKSCDGSVVSFCIIPNPLSGINDVWLSVKRTILSGTYAGVSFQLERMSGKEVSRESAYEATAAGGSPAEPFLVDAAVAGPDSGDPAVVSIPYTCGHLSGRAQLTGNYYSKNKGIFKMLTGAVSNLGAANYIAPFPVDYGTAGNGLVAGLPFTSTVRLTRFEAGSVIGTAQGAIAKVARVFLRVVRSMSCKVVMVGKEVNSAAEPVNFKDGNTTLGQSAEIYTGLSKKIMVPSTYDRDGVLEISQSDPLPFALMGVVAEGEEID